jgi:hypothetical protein
LRSLSEAECYTRCYGGWEPSVRIVKGDPRRASPPLPGRFLAADRARRLIEEPFRRHARRPHEPA